MIYELTFIKEDLEGVDTPQNDALVLIVNICNYDVKRVLINPGSSLEVMYPNLYNYLRPFIPKKAIQSVDLPIYIFNGKPVWLIAIVELLVRIGQVTMNMEFFIMNIDSPYNAILGIN